ncbi:MAG: histidine--tRNA ligase, partial [Chlamydiae bacterium]|nr:histidine--tRNA ligase [Chlamydiota bacterium]
NQLGLKNLTIIINSVGGKETRSRFIQALKDFLEPKFNKLSEDSQYRFSKNMLRILDSKDPIDIQELADAPSILNFLTTEERQHFDTVCSLLTQLNIPYKIEPRLVRGLDYYNKTVFEITTSDLGAQNSLGGGGRYDGLIETLGGPNLPSVGFGTGLERVLQTMDRQNVFFPDPNHPLVFFIPLGENARKYCFELTSKLRHKKIFCEIDLSGKKIQNGLQMANHVAAEYAIIIGDEEIANNKAQIKNLKTRESRDTPLESLIKIIPELNK